MGAVLVRATSELSERFAHVRFAWILYIYGGDVHENGANFCCSSSGSTGHALSTHVKIG